MKILIFFALILFGHATTYSQRSHIRHINIEDCNSYDLIFVGEVKKYETIGKRTEVTFSIDEIFKSRTRSCEVKLNTLHQIPTNLDSFPDEKWLIFGHEYDGELYFDFDQSTGLSHFQSYPEEIIQTDLLYLQNLAQNPTRLIKEIYQSSGIGCKPDDGYYIAEGRLENSFPNEEWKYYSSEGVVQMEGSYKNGKKSGVWYEYHENGFVATKVIYFENWELKRIQYDNHGDLYCFNEDCIFWTPHPKITIPFLLPSEKKGSLKKK